tara:strand:- start:1592 stop:2596 length:1005 start_codon:yes stop_codon:yes gene_type:complete
MYPDEDTQDQEEEIFEIEEVLDELEDENIPAVEKEKSLDDEPILSDEPDESNDDKVEEAEKPKKPTRAEKRIRGLISQNKQNEKELSVAAEYIKKLSVELRSVQNRTVTAESAYMEEADDRLTAQLNQVRKDWQIASTEGDDTGMFDAQERLADIKVEQRNLSAVKASMEVVEEIPPEEGAESTARLPLPKPDPRAMRWAKENKDWFIPVGGENSPLNTRKTAMVSIIHKELLTEGYDPADVEDEHYGKEAYYDEIDKRLSGEFSAQITVEGEDEESKPQSVVAGGAHTPSSVTTKGGKTKVKLTRSEISSANRMGVPLQEYAKQKAIIARRGA